MTDQTNPAQNGEKLDPASPPIKTVEPVASQTTEPATAQQLAIVEEQMTGFERATLRWAKIAVLMSGLAALFVCAQWYEMHVGGQDTHALAVAAGTQATKLSNVSDAADKIKQAAQDMVTQDQRIADNAKNAVDASSAQSKATLDASIAASQVDQRAWMYVTGFELSGELQENQPFLIKLGLANSGKTPNVRVITQTMPYVWYGGEPPATKWVIPLPNPPTVNVISPGGGVMTAQSQNFSINGQLLSFYNSNAASVYIHARVDY